MRDLQAEGVQTVYKQLDINDPSSVEVRLSCLLYPLLAQTARFVVTNLYSSEEGTAYVRYIDVNSLALMAWRAAAEGNAT